jgi:hypothetical protein
LYLRECFRIFGLKTGSFLLKHWIWNWIFQCTCRISSEYVVLYDLKISNILAESGINHGVEMYENVVEYAQENLQTIIKRPAISAFGFCVPEFFVGSAFYVQNGMEYDRIYCGALVPKNRRFYFCNMLKIGGILVMPYASRVRESKKQSTAKKPAFLRYSAKIIKILVASNYPKRQI